MQPGKVNQYLRILIIILFTGAVILMAGRSHFILGTILIVSRWIILVVGIVLLYAARKRVIPTPYTVAVAAVILALAIEYAWNKAGERTLAETSQTGTEITLMTYNIFFRNPDPGSAISMMEGYDPDILALQEVTPALRTQLDRSLGSNYPFRQSFPFQGTHGIATYSRYPITAARLLSNSNDLPFALVMELDIEGRKIQVINVHLASPAVAVENPGRFFALYKFNYELRALQLAEISRIINDTEAKFSAQVLLGDLNTTVVEPLWRETRKEWVNLYDLGGTGSGFNFPNSGSVRPLVTLDYILGRGSIEVIEMNVMEGGNSDHLAVVGKLRI